MSFHKSQFIRQLHITFTDCLVYQIIQGHGTSNTPQVKQSIVNNVT
jgi:hypothetical protein